jgi:hypothetical protein
MPIGPGTRLGPYEVTALIGEGGMGKKVWRAHHTALKRDDALKVLPDALASDLERLARFRREAQVLASLNHPNIAHVYGLEQSDGVQALAIARQMAEGLEAAHEQGIIHRDLKPAELRLLDMEAPHCAVAEGHQGRSYMLMPPGVSPRWRISTTHLARVFFVSVGGSVASPWR